MLFAVDELQQVEDQGICTFEVDKIGTVEGLWTEIGRMIMPMMAGEHVNDDGFDAVLYPKEIGEQYLP